MHKNDITEVRIYENDTTEVKEDKLLKILSHRFLTWDEAYKYGSICRKLLNKKMKEKYMNDHPNNEFVENFIQKNIDFCKKFLDNYQIIELEKFDLGNVNTDNLYVFTRKYYAGETARYETMDYVETFSKGLIRLNTDLTIDKVLIPCEYGEIEKLTNNLLLVDDCIFFKLSGDKCECLDYDYCRRIIIKEDKDNKYPTNYFITKKEDFGCVKMELIRINDRERDGYQVVANLDKDNKCYNDILRNDKLNPYLFVTSERNNGGQYIINKVKKINLKTNKTHCFEIKKIIDITEYDYLPNNIDGVPLDRKDCPKIVILSKNGGCEAIGVIKNFDGERTLGKNEILIGEDESIEILTNFVYSRVDFYESTYPLKMILDEYDDIENVIPYPAQVEFVVKDCKGNKRFVKFCDGEVPYVSDKVLGHNKFNGVDNKVCDEDELPF